MKYYIYVIELDKEVGKIVKFRKPNPKFLLGNRCFYVGQSAKKPEIRFKQHKEGYKSNTYARRFGIKLAPEFYEKYNPIPTRKDAEELEEYVALNLRKERFGVWFNLFKLLMILNCLVDFLNCFHTLPVFAFHWPPHHQVHDLQN